MAIEALSASSTSPCAMLHVDKCGNTAQESPVTVFEDARALRPAQRRLAPAKLEALISEYEATARVRELASVYGLHRTTVSKHVARVGRTRPVMTEAQIDKAVRLYREGWTLHEVSRRLGVTDQGVRRVLAERAVTIPPGGRGRPRRGDIKWPGPRVRNRAAWELDIPGLRTCRLRRFRT